jgi:hypothetical protein
LEKLIQSFISEKKKKSIKKNSRNETTENEKQERKIKTVK